MEEIKTGVYICHCGLNIAGTVGVEEVARYAGTLPNVVVARHYQYMCSDPGQALIKDDIKNLGLNRVVVASCSPRMHEPTFRRACQDAGLNPYLYEHANIREHCSWVHDDKQTATEKAKDLVRAAVRRVSHNEPLEIKERPLNSNVLVVGGGIAGIQAALDIANGEHRVYLVEKEPAVGGHMAQIDRTFPTLDCSECILTPKMTEVGQHPFITLLAYSEIQEVFGSIGSFKAKIRKKARYVDAVKCVGCGNCEKKCPRRTDSEFDVGLAERGMAYIPFPQAVPHIATIDKKEERPCKAACKDACPIHMNVPGYVSLIKEGKLRDAYELMRRTNPLPAVCGRVCYAPCEDACNRGQMDEPVASRALKRFVADQVNIDSLEIPQVTKNGKKVAIIGSGPAGLAAAHDLALKGYEMTIFEALPEPGGMLRYGIPEYRLPKDILKSEIEYIERLGIEIETNTRIGEETQFEELRKAYQALFLATGAPNSLRLDVPGEDLPGVIQAIEFLRDVNMAKKVEVGRRVAVIGGGNTAIDASRVARRLGAEVKVIYRRSRAEMPAAPEEIEAAEAEGIKIDLLAAPTEMLAEAGKVSKMKCIRMELGEPDESGRRRPIPIEDSEFIVDADTVIAALGQASDAEFAERLGLKASHRGTIAVDEATLATNIEGVFAGGDATTGPAMVIDAIAAGKKAAQSIDEYLKGEVLTSKESKITPRKLSEEEISALKQRFPRQNRVKAKELASEARARSFEEVERGYVALEAQQESGRCLTSQIEGCIECGECKEACEAKAIDFSQTDQVVEIEAGTIIVATGYDLFDPSVIPQYGYKKYDNVLTGLEFERLTCAAGPTEGKILLKDGREPESVAIIHCVGSRDQNYHEYCSRVCCMYGLKYAHLIKENTQAAVYQMYIDMRCFGEGYEEFYRRVSDEGVSFIRGKVAKVTDVTLTEEEKGKLIVVAEDTLLGRIVRVPADMVILCPALEARSDAEDIAKLFAINRRADGFFLEKHVKLDPVATATDGVFIAGCCEGPKDIPDTVAQASAAAAKALSVISRGRVVIEPTTAQVNEALCQACGRCEEICDFHAPRVISKDGVRVSSIDEALCKGCGACAVVCPTGAMSVRHFTRQQINAMVEALLEV
jgi:heterodisulfide reductase subunit A